MGEEETRRYVLKGRVQGIGFRYRTKSYASGMGISGWVRNRDDGSVEVLATAPRGKLDRLSEWLKHGVPGSAVERIEMNDAQADSLSRGFHIVD